MTPLQTDVESSGDYVLQERPQQEESHRLPPWLRGSGEAIFDHELIDDGHPEYYMSAAAQERLDNDTSLTDYDRMLIQRLACRRFHIPGKNFWEDYLFWFQNNHPFFCFCYAHPLHPLGKGERWMNLLSTLAFGLAASSGIILWYSSAPDRDFDRAFFSVFGYEVSIGMLTMLAFAGPLHVVFDLSMFFIQSCPPFRTGGLFEPYLPESWRKCCLFIGAHLAFLITIGAVSLAINASLARASLLEDGDADGFSTAKESYRFLGLYLVEVFFANFIVFPLGTFTVFSGVLGCGVLPGIGGRPYQKKKWQKVEAERLRKEGPKQQTSSDSLPSMQ